MSARLTREQVEAQREARELTSSIYRLVRDRKDREAWELVYRHDAALREELDSH